MALNDLIIKKPTQQKAVGLTEERLRAIFDPLRKYISFWREYPDLMVDFMLEHGGNPQNFRFFFYQRVFLRTAMRYQYVYCTFPRAYSKSFLATLVLMLKCILYPRCKLFVTSGGKEQAASIIKEKVQELCNLIPALRKEIDWTKGVTLEGKDYAKYTFKNGSYFDNIAARESSRGRRRHGGVVEECVGVDGQILQEVIIPTMNVSRLCMDGSSHPEEQINKSQLYITTAGYKNTFPYDKLIQLLVWQIVKPEKAMVLGGTYKIPVLVHLLDKDFVRDLRDDGTFNEASFQREYESIWTGTSEDAFFNPERFDRNRIVKLSEHEYNNRIKTGYYILGVDVARRKNCDSVVTVVKVMPQPQGPALKSLVNIFVLNDAHFEDQTKEIKRLYYKYKARRVVIDGNGLGVGLLDYMVKAQIDPDTGDYFPPFGVYNDKDGEYKQYRTKDTEDDAIYIVKANPAINSVAYTYVQSTLNSGKIKFLVDEQTAKTKLMGTKVGQNMTPDQRAKYLRPYVLTTALREELLNLREESDGANLKLKPVKTNMGKDKVSSLTYALYYVREEEENKKKKQFKASDWLMMN